METRIVVDNLKCGGCANSIKKSLKKIEGVNAVAVEVDQSEITLLHELGVSKQLILSRLSDLGYPEQGTTNGTQRLKSYLSCAVGRMSN